MPRSPPSCVGPPLASGCPPRLLVCSRLQVPLSSSGHSCREPPLRGCARVLKRLCTAKRSASNCGSPEAQLLRHLWLAFPQLRVPSHRCPPDCKTHVHSRASPAFSQCLATATHRQFSKERAAPPPFSLVERPRSEMGVALDPRCTSCPNVVAAIREWVLPSSGSPHPSRARSARCDGTPARITHGLGQNHHRHVPNVSSSSVETLDLDTRHWAQY